MNHDTNVDQREPHQCDPPRPVEVKELEKLGVLYYKVRDLSNQSAESVVKLFDMMII